MSEQTTRAPFREATIPPAVLDAMTACKALVDVRDRDAAMKWLLVHRKREEAKWVIYHPADYPRLLDALTYWARLKEAS